MACLGLLRVSVGSEVSRLRWRLDAIVGCCTCFGIGRYSRNCGTAESSVLPNDNRLWVTDGTASGTSQILFQSNPIVDIEGLVPVGSNRMLFARLQGTRPSEVWGTDGTSQGTQRLSTGVLQSNFDEVSYLATNGRALFRTLGNSTSRLWTTDGTATGTSEIILPRGGSIRWLNSSDQLAWFTVRSASRFELWKSDGTSVGTTFVTVLPYASTVTSAIAIDDKVFFADLNTASAPGNSIWVSDGTAAGTSRLLTKIPAARRDQPVRLFSAFGQLHFAVNDGVAGYRLWKSDGTLAGTQPFGRMQADYFRHSHHTRLPTEISRSSDFGDRFTTPVSPMNSASNSSVCRPIRWRGFRPDSSMFARMHRSSSGTECLARIRMTFKSSRSERHPFHRPQSPRQTSNSRFHNSTETFQSACGSAGEIKAAMWGRGPADHSKWLLPMYRSCIPSQR